MTDDEFLRMVEEVIEASPNTLTGREALADIPEWDSLAVLSFMAKVDEVLGQQLSAAAIVKAKTMAELRALLPSG